MAAAAARTLKKDLTIFSVALSSAADAHGYTVTVSTGSIHLLTIIFLLRNSVGSNITKRIFREQRQSE